MDQNFRSVPLGRKCTIAKKSLRLTSDPHPEIRSTLRHLQSTPIPSHVHWLEPIVAGVARDRFQMV